MLLVPSVAAMSAWTPDFIEWQFYNGRVFTIGSIAGFPYPVINHSIIIRGVTNSTGHIYDNGMRVSLINETPTVNLNSTNMNLKSLLVGKTGSSKKALDVNGTLNVTRGINVTEGVWIAGAKVNITWSYLNAKLIFAPNASNTWANIKMYVDAKNNSMRTYALALNTTMKSYANAKFVPYTGATSNLNLSTKKLLFNKGNVTGVRTINFSTPTHDWIGDDPNYPGYSGWGNSQFTLWFPNPSDSTPVVQLGYNQNFIMDYGLGSRYVQRFYGYQDLTNTITINYTTGKSIETYFNNALSGNAVVTYRTIKSGPGTANNITMNYRGESRNMGNFTYDAVDNTFKTDSKWSFKGVNMSALKVGTAIYNTTWSYNGAKTYFDKRYMYVNQTASNAYVYNGSQWLPLNATSKGQLRVVFW